MDTNRFDEATRLLTEYLARRDVLRGLAGAGLGLGAARLPDVAEAKKKRKRKKRKPKPNAFGCIDVGQACQSADACCSGICQGKKGNRKCAAHNTGGCTAQFDGCRTLVVGCGTAGFCFRTTGKASFCGGPGGECRECARDTDCETDFGAGAACVVCDDCIPFSGVTTVCYPSAA